MSTLEDLRTELDEEHRLERESGEVCVNCWQYPLQHQYVLKDREIICPMQSESYGGSHGRKATRYEGLGMNHRDIWKQLQRYLPMNDLYFMLIWDRYKELR